MAERYVSEKSEITFPVYVGEVGGPLVTIMCKQDSTVSSLILQIRRDMTIGLEDFHLKRKIDVYERVRIPGSITKPIDYMRKLSEFKEKHFILHLQGKEPQLEKAEKYCCNQNIILIGSPGHGKSSTINSIARAFRLPTVIAQTFTAGGTGTAVFTKHTIKAESSSFSLWDVPGTALQGSDQQIKVTLRNIFDGKEEENKKLGENTAWFSKNSRKIHAIICIQNGSADTEGLNVLTLQAAKETGRGIPVFVIITHQDKLTAKALQEKKEKLGNEVGVDQNVIFTIANDDSVSDQHEDPQKEEYVRSVMCKILLAAKVHMEATGSTGTCGIQ